VLRDDNILKTIQNITLSGQFKISHCRDNPNYRTVGTIQNIALSGQSKISHCRDIPKSNRKFIETEAKLIILKHKCMTAHITGFGQAFH
jgi:hypothetical protein